MLVLGSFTNSSTDGPSRRAYRGGQARSPRTRKSTNPTALSRRESFALSSSPSSATRKHYSRSGLETLPPLESHSNKAQEDGDPDLSQEHSIQIPSSGCSDPEPHMEAPTLKGTGRHVERSRQGGKGECEMLSGDLSENIEPRWRAFEEL